MIDSPPSASGQWTLARTGSIHRSASMPMPVFAPQIVGLFYFRLNVFRIMVRAEPAH
jgi:hypothetical protein